MESRRRLLRQHSQARQLGVKDAGTVAKEEDIQVYKDNKKQGEIPVSVRATVEMNYNGQRLRALIYPRDLNREPYPSSGVFITQGLAERLGIQRLGSLTLIGARYE